MTKSEKAKLRYQIQRLEQKKDSLVDNFIGQCEQINDEIRYYKKQIKTNQTNVECYKDC